MRPGPITSRCFPADPVDLDTEIVTSCGHESERVPCRSASGIPEFYAEVRRICSLRDEALSAGEEWEPVDVSIMYGETVQDSRRVTAETTLVLTLEGAFA